jgi:hypothetical protein
MELVTESRLKKEMKKEDDIEEEEKVLPGAVGLRIQ